MFHLGNDLTMLTLIDVQVLVKVAELHSVTGAARALGMPKSSVSRNLARLEDDLGATLVQRAGKQLTLTDMGEVFYRHAQRILGDVEEAQNAVGQLRGSPRGHLRVAAPVTYGQFLLAPLLAEFLARYPELTLALELTSRRLNPIEEQIDVVIHVGPLEDSRLVARKLGTFPLWLFASPAYLAAHGTPTRVPDLAGHTVMDIFEGPRDWILEGPEGETSIAVTPRLSVNDPSACMTAALGGTGLAWMPPFLGAKEVADGRLVRVLPDWRRGVREVHALFPSPRTLSPRVRAFIDYLIEKVVEPASSNTHASQVHVSTQPADRCPAPAR
ncbi:LysR family transcriptional regulator [soil metagenome]